MLFPMFANNPNKSPSPGFGEKVCYGLGDFASCIMGAVTNYILMSHMRRFDHLVLAVSCFAFSHMRHLGIAITKVIVGFPIGCLGFLYHNLRRRSFPAERCNIIQTYQLSLQILCHK